MNFDGFSCEIVFNTFESFRNTVIAFLFLLNVLLVYPIKDYFGQPALQTPAVAQRTALAQLGVLLGVRLSAAVLHLALREQRLLRRRPGLRADRRPNAAQQTRPPVRGITRRSSA